MKSEWYNQDVKIERWLLASKKTGKLLQTEFEYTYFFKWTHSWLLDPQEEDTPSFRKFSKYLLIGAA
jgi:hypothetical protein